MKRTNTFDITPQAEWKQECLRRVLDASAALFNETNYKRRQAFIDEDGDVWDVDTGKLEGQYKGVIGGSTAQQIIRKNSDMWTSFFEKLGDSDDDEHVGLPGYWKEDGERDLLTFIRNDAYSTEWNDHSRLEILVGQDLKDEYGIGYHDRLRLTVRGNPKWSGSQGQLQLTYDDTHNQFEAYQTITVPDSQVNTPLASEQAALDIGANNLVAVTTTTGEQRLYEGRELFREYRDTTEDIASLKSKLPENRDSSKRIGRLYRKRTERRNHAQDALVRDLMEWLYDEGVDTVYVGDLADVLETHWDASVNEKTHSFWAHSRFTDRLDSVAEEFGISVVEESEAWTSQTCPVCGARESTVRHEDTLTCSCGFEGHADVVGSYSFLAGQREEQGVQLGFRPMARPVRFEWDNHEWRADHSSPPVVGTTTKEQRTNPIPENTTQVTLGEVASGTSV